MVAGKHSIGGCGQHERKWVGRPPLTNQPATCPSPAARLHCSGHPADRGARAQAQDQGGGEGGQAQGAAGQQRVVVQAAHQQARGCLASRGAGAASRGARHFVAGGWMGGVGRSSQEDVACSPCPTPLTAHPRAPPTPHPTHTLCLTFHLQIQQTPARPRQRGAPQGHLGRQALLQRHAELVAWGRA